MTRSSLTANEVSACNLNEMTTMLTIANRQCSRVIFLLVIFIVDANAECSELKMIHVMFRHGERTPTGTDAGERYPKDPYLNETFFPVGLGSLTNEGKMSMYNLGTFLRRRYNDFLGDLYYPGVTRVRCTESPRSMMSAELVSAGLWPPAETQQWNKDLLWMPVPYEYVPANMDSLLWPYKCPAYDAEYNRILQTDEVQKLIEPHREFFAYLSKHTGANITRPQQVFFIYHTLDSQVNCNLTLPAWTRDLFPNGKIYEITLLQYDLCTWGNLLKRMYGGPLLHDVLKDYKKLMGNTSLNKLSPKITLYSGHESNICSLLKIFDLWKPHIPDFSAAIIFELYLNRTINEFGIQIIYYLGRSGKMITLTLPGCTQICPINRFTELLSNMIPDDVDELCGIKNQSSFVSLEINLYITLQMLILFKIT